MEYNCKIVNYNDDIQVSFYDKKYKRKEGSAEEDVKRSIKSNQLNSIDNQQSTWYNPKTCKVEDIPQGFEVIEHPFSKETMLFPLPQYVQCDTWISLEFEVLQKLVQQQMEEEEERKQLANVYRSMRRTKQTIYSICRANKWELFVTFTIANKDKRYDLDEVKKLVSTRIRSIRTNNKLSFAYVLIPEQHKDGAWHFHGLFKDIKGLHLERALTPQGKRVIKNEKQVYTIKEFEKLGFNSATYVQDNSKVCSYITKYVTKELTSKGNGKRNYLVSKGLSRGDEVLFDLDSIDDIEGKLVEALGYEPTLTHGRIVYNPYKECNAIYKQYKK